MIEITNTEVFGWEAAIRGMRNPMNSWDKSDSCIDTEKLQILPSSYNQKRTIQLNYEVLVGIYKWRKDHKLDEWRTFCEWIKSLPHSEVITGD